MSGLPARFETATGDPRLNGAIVTADPATGLATAIERVSLSADDIERLVAEAAAGPRA